MCDFVVLAHTVVRHLTKAYCFPHSRTSFKKDRLNCCWFCTGRFRSAPLPGKGERVSDWVWERMSEWVKEKESESGWPNELERMSEREGVSKTQRVSESEQERENKILCHRNQAVPYGANDWSSEKIALSVICMFMACRASPRNKIGHPKVIVLNVCWLRVTCCCFFISRLRQVFSVCWLRVAEFLFVRTLRKGLNVCWLRVGRFVFVPKLRNVQYMFVQSLRNILNVGWL